MLATVLFGTYTLLKYQGAICEFYLPENMIQLGESTSIYLGCKIILEVVRLCYCTVIFLLFHEWIVSHFAWMFWVFIVPGGYLVYLSSFWSVTTFLVWCRLLTSLHMASLVISFASPNFICSSEKRSRLTEVPSQWHNTDKGRYKSL